MGALEERRRKRVPAETCASRDGVLVHGKDVSSFLRDRRRQEKPKHTWEEGSLLMADLAIPSTGGWHAGPHMRLSQHY